MANTLDGAIVICRNVEFEFKLKIVMAIIAKEILAEASDVQYHIMRVRWATRSQTRTVDEVKKVCLLLSFLPPIELSSADSVIVSAVRENVDTFAGAFNEEPEPIDDRIVEVIIDESDHDNNPNTKPVVTKRSIFSFFRRKK